MKKILFILLLTSCSEEDIPSSCLGYAESCQSLLRQIDQAKTEKEKDQLRQFYLANKSDLEKCKKNN